ncbi:DUF6464 family protein [Oscillatoria salina]|uniref:DUF6464 family protein n=1 Tax=Oscillatoria salina TaxID=331517 RepID=UPI001CC951D1|nr:DUF6464 family protein [Oscillatoria salina]
MFEIILIFIFALMPLLISLLLLRKAKQRWQARLRQMRNFRQRQTIASPSREGSRFEIGNYFIGDLTCRYNARSPHVRCAVNPDGPCEGCRHYEARD